MLTMLVTFCLTFAYLWWQRAPVSNVDVPAPEMAARVPVGPPRSRQYPHPAPTSEPTEAPPTEMPIPTQPDQARRFIRRH